MALNPIEASSTWSAGSSYGPSMRSATAYTVPEVSRGSHRWRLLPVHEVIGVGGAERCAASELICDHPCSEDAEPPGSGRMLHDHVLYQRVRNQHRIGRVLFH